MPKKMSRKEWEQALGISLEPAGGNSIEVFEGEFGMVCLLCDFGDDEETSAGTIGYYDDDDCWEDENGEGTAGIVYLGVPFHSEALSVAHGAMRPATPAEIKKWLTKVYNDASFERCCQGGDSPAPICGDTPS